MARKHVVSLNSTWSKIIYRFSLEFYDISVAFRNINTSNLSVGVVGHSVLNVVENFVFFAWITIIIRTLQLFSCKSQRERRILMTRLTTSGASIGYLYVLFCVQLILKKSRKTNSGPIVLTWSWPWPWFIPHPTGHIGPHSYAIRVWHEELPPLLPLRWTPFL